MRLFAIWRMTHGWHLATHRERLRYCIPWELSILPDISLEMTKGVAPQSGSNNLRPPLNWEVTFMLIAGSILTS